MDVCYRGIAGAALVPEISERGTRHKQPIRQKRPNEGIKALEMAVRTIDSFCRGESVPIIQTVDHERKQVDAIAIARIHYADVEDHLLQERYFGGLAYKKFIDARVAEISFTLDEIRQIVTLLRSLGQHSKLGPTAVLVSSEAAFGIMRMLEMLAEDVVEVRPFRDEPEARLWLASQS